MNTNERVMARNGSTINLIVGIWFMLSPYIFGYAAMATQRWNDIIVGFIIAILALYRLFNPARAEWVSIVNAILGLWLIVSPFVMFYPTLNARWDNIIAGLIVLIAGGYSANVTRQMHTHHAARA